MASLGGCRRAGGASSSSIAAVQAAGVVCRRWHPGRTSEARERSGAVIARSGQPRALPGWARALREQTGLDIGLRRCGVLMLASADPAVAEADLQAQAAPAQSAARPRSARRSAGARQRSAASRPGLAPVAGALRFAEDGQVEPPRLLAALTAAAQAQSALLRGEVQRITLASFPGRDHSVSFLPEAGEASQPASRARAGAVRRKLVCQHCRHAAASQRLSVLPRWSGLLAPSPLSHEPGLNEPAKPAMATSSRVAMAASSLALTERVGQVKAVTTAGLLDLLTLAGRWYPPSAPPPSPTPGPASPGSADELPLIGR